MPVYNTLIGLIFVILVFSVIFVALMGAFRGTHRFIKHNGGEKILSMLGKILGVLLGITAVVLILYMSHKIGQALTNQLGLL